MRKTLGRLKTYVESHIVESRIVMLLLTGISSGSIGVVAFYMRDPINACISGMLFMQCIYIATRPGIHSTWTEIEERNVREQMEGQFSEFLQSKGLQQHGPGMFSAEVVSSDDLPPADKKH